MTLAEEEWLGQRPKRGAPMFAMPPLLTEEEVTYRTRVARVTSVARVTHATSVACVTRCRRSSPTMAAPQTLHP